MSVSDRIINWLESREAEKSDAAVKITVDTDLLERGMLDSLDFLQLLTFLEDEFDLEIPVDLLTPENFATPKVAGALVEKIQAEGAV